MSRLIRTTVFVFMLNNSIGLCASNSSKVNQSLAVKGWLDKHPAYRLANDQDCKCDQDLRTIRTLGYGGVWKANPKYNPYEVIGDLNGDGISDLAVVVINTQKAHDFTLLIFNGPIDVHHLAPAFVWEHQDLGGIGLFYGPPRPKPYRLIIGKFESEGLVLTPSARTYRLEN